MLSPLEVLHVGHAPDRMAAARASHTVSGERTPLTACVALQCDGASHPLARIGNRSAHRARRHGQRTRQKHLGLLVPHAAGEVAIGRADAAERLIEPAERVARTAQTGRT